jgi:hypothetical protein
VLDPGESQVGMMLNASGVAHRLRATGRQRTCRNSSDVPSESFCVKPGGTLQVSKPRTPVILLVVHLGSTKERRELLVGRG